MTGEFSILNLQFTILFERKSTARVGERGAGKVLTYNLQCPFADWFEDAFSRDRALIFHEYRTISPHSAAAELRCKHSGPDHVPKKPEKRSQI